MDLNTITVANFKAFFRRDFPYLPTYDSTKIYNINDESYSGGLFYASKQDGLTATAPPGAAWNKVEGNNADDYVQDDDISKAFLEAQVNLNQALFGSDSQIQMGYYYLTAHYLVNDLRAALQGVEGSAAFPVVGRNVGGVSENYQIPQDYLDDPVLSFYTSTPYGMKFLSLVLPSLRGNVGVVAGWTNP